METLRDGSFMLTIDAEALAKGLRPSAKTARNKEYLVECIGAVGLDNVLQVLEDLNLSRIDTAVIVDGFPYPQIFVFTNMIIVCGETDIYEWIGGALVLRLGPVAAGTLWTAVDFKETIYMSNGKVAVLRNPLTGVFSITTALPIATAICDFNSQVFTGSPDETWI
jgi:hypothetical protein